tara:strand:- start:8004 stop:8897 length:894 start_codon:yes stop_codon:yes gene_type:complete
MNKLKILLISPLILLGFVTASLKSEDKVLNISAIPDQNQEILDRRFNLFSREIERELNVKVKYLPVVNYVAAVTSFRTKNLDVVWFGGLTGVQARLQTPNSLVLAQRDIDKKFQSVFIINKKLELNSTMELNDLKYLKNYRFTFGSENSTSGRLMPEYFLNKAGIKISDFKGKKAGFSGSHDATIALVNSGAFDAGVVNKQILERNLKYNRKRTKNINVFFISPDYSDYHWLAQGDLDKKFYKGFTSTLKKTILNFNKENPSQREILKMFNANSFINADASEYNNIELIGRKLKKIR